MNIHSSMTNRGTNNFRSDSDCGCTSTTTTSGNSTSSSSCLRKRGISIERDNNSNPSQCKIGYQSSSQSTSPSSPTLHYYNDCNTSSMSSDIDMVVDVDDGNDKDHHNNRIDGTKHRLPLSFVVSTMKQTKIQATTNTNKNGCMTITKLYLLTLILCFIIIGMTTRATTSHHHHHTSILCNANDNVLCSVWIKIRTIIRPQQVHSSDYKNRDSGINSSSSSIDYEEVGLYTFRQEQHQKSISMQGWFEQQRSSIHQRDKPKNNENVGTVVVDPSTTNEDVLLDDKPLGDRAKENVEELSDVFIGERTQADVIVEVPKDAILLQEQSISTRSFPKWGNTVDDENLFGISYDHIHEFILSTSLHHEEHIPTFDHDQSTKTPVWYAPETLYTILQDDDTSLQYNDTVLLPSIPKIYTSLVHRNVHLEVARLNKLNTTERIMLQAIQILHDEYISFYTNINVNINDTPKSSPTSKFCHESQWPTLCTTLYETDDSSTDRSGSWRRGFPFFAWYGDYRGCNYQNWNLPSSYNQGENITSSVSIPLFTVAADVTCNYTFPFPNYYHIKDSRTNAQQWDDVMDAYKNKYPFENKIRQVVWRGSLTGRIDDSSTKCPRWKFVQATYNINQKRRRQQQTISSTNSSEEEYRDLFDVQIINIPPKVREFQSDFESDIGIKSDDPNAIHIGDDKKAKIKFENFQWYRAILDIDGHSWSGRFGSLLSMNSVVLKVDPHYVDYFYAKIPQRNDNQNVSNEYSTPKPWVHYIPIKEDFSNLEDMAEYALDSKNDDTIQTIIRNANNWCRANMIESVIAHDMLSVWDRYVELLNINNPNWMNQYIYNTFTTSRLLTNDDPLQMIKLEFSDY